MSKSHQGGVSMKKKRRQNERGGGKEEEEDDDDDGIEKGKTNSCFLSILGWLKKMLFCCCWPVSKCSKVLSAFDTFLVGFCAYRAGCNLIDTINNVHWTAIVAFLFFTFFFICQIIGTIFICLASKKNIASYCLPRLVLTGGLSICSFLSIVLLIYYFSGSSKSVNKYIFKTFEYLFNEKLTEVDKVEMKHQLFYYGVGFFILAVVYFIYNLFVFFVTNKFKSTLNDFETVPTEASAPQLSQNPDYRDSPKKYYPNNA